MKCLTDVQIQAIVDREAPEALQEHAASCPRCSDRVREREDLTAAILQTINVSVGIPPAVSRHVEQALAEGSSHGATRLRRSTPPPQAWRHAAWSAAAVAAATLITILFVAPLFKGPATVSAAEILARSADRLAQRVTTGIEFLDYELTLDGVPREMMPDHADGIYRVKQVIDHDTTGRYFVATYDPGGQLLSSVAQDPASNRRIMTVRVEDQPYRFEFSVPANVALSPPEMERLHMEASVAMMQASGNQHLQVIERDNGRQYRIEVPQLGAQTPNAVWDLSEARVLIDANDYHIVEFAVRGTFLKRPYSVSYRLISRAIAKGADVQASEFEVPVDTRAIRIEGEGSAIPVRDALVLALRELARVKQAR